VRRFAMYASRRRDDPPRHHAVPPV